MNPTRFRILISAEIALTICFFTFSYFSDPFLPKQLQDFYSYNIPETALRFYNWLAIPELALVILSWIFIWRFSRYSREFYFTLVLYGWISHALIRYETVSGISLMLTLAAGFLSGVILCSAYFSSISSYFQKTEQGAGANG